MINRLVITTFESIFMPQLHNCVIILILKINVKKTGLGIWKETPKQNVPAGNYMFKVNNRNTRTRCEICSKLTIKI